MIRVQICPKCGILYEPIMVKKCAVCNNNLIKDFKLLDI